MRVDLEIAVTSPAGARAARRGGADRVELCTALELGGLTPSVATVDHAVAEELPVHVLVRCRPGDFRYDAEEVATMVADVHDALRRGAAGVVVGALDADGIDQDAVSRLVAAARDVRPEAPVTFHRAIDHLPEPAAQLTLLQRLGVDRVLTSGGAPSAPEGTAELGAMVAAADGLQVMAGGGVTVASLQAVLATGVHAVHLSAKRRAPTTAGPWVSLGSSAGSAEQDAHYTTDPALVAAARGALDAHGRR